MRTAFALLFILIAGGAIDSVQANPYRWCAPDVGLSSDSNCTFVTLEQCRAAILVMGGFCQRSKFYTGSDAPRRRIRWGG